ncbi:putative muramoyltetrapeptide carboxypeptidase (LD-carboxypeptidase A) [Neisseria meningitidis]|nr:putative muramoyltetrapeptide carboxypeptidase (LD-carboxypeptidase A) [Neisseria meningitidis]
MTEPTSRRRFLKTCTAAAGAGLLQACGTAPASNNAPSAPSHPVAKARTVYPEPPHHSNSADNLLRIVASSGFAEDINRVNTALTRLYNAGFTVTNPTGGQPPLPTVCRYGRTTCRRFPRCRFRSRCHTESSDGFARRLWCGTHSAAY